MAIINRVARLFKADLHAVLDHIEEPELQLKQALREMQEELLEIENKIHALEVEQDHLTHNQANSEQLIMQADDEIVICLENENSELAKTMIRRKLEAEKMLRVIEQQYSQSIKRMQELKKQQQEYTASFNSMQQKADLFALSLSKKANPATNKITDYCMPEISDSDVEVALLKEQKKFKEQGAYRKSGEAVDAKSTASK